MVKVKNRFDPSAYILICQLFFIVYTILYTFCLYNNLFCLYKGNDYIIYGVYLPYKDAIRLNNYNHKRMVLSRVENTIENIFNRLLTRSLNCVSITTYW